ncbi:MAG: hypothetical protein HUJ66_06370 [Oscillospiraceae bacterium]|nr:hypothetical protein [Oscillospiraceae bacterium]
MADIRRVLDRLQGVTQNGKDSWMAKCPCHKDSNPSLSVGVGRDGRVLLNCFAGCEFGSIVSALSLSTEDLMPGKAPAQKSRGFDFDAVIAEYRYPNGTRKLRDSSKRFIWQHGDSSGVWRAGRGDAPHALYVKGPESHETFIVEGEKDVENLSRLGFFCACSEDGAGTAGKWYPEYNGFFKGRAVYILQDNDEVGKCFARVTAGALASSADSVRVLDLTRVYPELPEKGDVSDLIAAVGDRRAAELVLQLAQSTEVFVLPPRQALELARDSGGNVKATAQNFADIIRNDAKFADLRFNVMSGYPERLTDGRRVIWTDADDGAARTYIEKTYGIYNRLKYEDGLRTVLREREYNPVLSLIEGVEYDGKPHAEEFLIKWMGAEDTPYNRECSRLLFAGGINRACDSGCKFDVVVVLIGEQGCGKSTLCRLLAMDDSMYNTLKTFSPPQCCEAIQGMWVVEIEELLAISDRDGSGAEERAKAFLSAQCDKYRDPYGRRATPHNRTCIFIGTTNHHEFLTDRTGNRRWYPVVCRQSSDYLYGHMEELREDIRQSWAELLEAYRSGSELASPTAGRELAETIKEHQRSAETDDYRIGVIAEFVEGRDRVCIPQIWREALHPTAISPPNCTTRESREIAAILRSLGFEADGTARFNKPYGIQKAFLRPGQDQFTAFEKPSACNRTSFG